MMTSLFSSFDPCASSLIFSNWLSTFMIFLTLPSIIWVNKNRNSVFIFNIFKTFYQEFKILTLSPYLNGSTLFFVSILMFIVLNNFLGLFPYIFTSSSHLVLALSLACPIWFTFMVFGWVNNTNNMFAHLLPLNTPVFLMPFLVLIETISLLIRSGTLTVRLSANMIAGHLLMTLLGNQAASNSNLMILILILMTQITLLTLESAVALIQAYVFSVLATLYSNEV